VEVASSLREEAHSAVQEIFKKLDEELPKQDEVAMQTRLEVEKTMKEIDNRLPLQEEVALQTRKEVQKIMEGLDERLQKQQEAALASMRQMMEKALSQSLNKIDKIQKDLHKLYATSKQQQQQQQQQRSNNDPEGAFHRNQYNRPLTRNTNAPPHEFSPDKRQQNKFAHYGEDQTHHGGNVHEGNALMGLAHGGSPGGNALLSPRLGMRAMRDPNVMQSFNAGRDGNSMQNFGSMREENSMRDDMSYVRGRERDGDPVFDRKRSVSLRLKQAGDMHPVTTSILSINNLPEVNYFLFLTRDTVKCMEMRALFSG